MNYFRYTGVLEDGERIEDVEVLMAISAEHMLRFGFVWMVERVVLALRKRIQFDRVVHYEVDSLTEDEVKEYTERPWMVADEWRKV
jgi:hypothetical protein